MTTESLKVSVLYGTGQEQPLLPAFLKDLPQVEVVTEAAHPEQLLAGEPVSAPDSVLVYLDGEQILPPWLTELTQKLPQTAVLVCSGTREPDFIIKAMQAGVREFLPLPLAREELEAALERVRTTRRRLQPVLVTRGKLVVVTAHKGGAGVTSLALNLGAALAELHGETVVLMDLGRPFPDICNFLDRESPYSIHDLVKNLSELDRDFMRKIVQKGDDNLAVLHGITDFHLQDSLDLTALDKIFSLLRGLYPWIVVDLSHWLDELFLHVLREADATLLLTELTVPDLRNLGNLWPTLREWPEIANKIHLVVNRHYKGNSVRVSNLEKLVRAKVFHLLPSDYEPLIEAINRGVPLGRVAPRSKLWTGIQEMSRLLSREILGEVEEGKAAGRSWRQFLGLGKGK
ncbi:MAG: MinD/ParA family protein [Deltaproteobacteria bacterium]|nr:MinD/ParA family protein [Deltaproteobacteria bacterium]